MDKAEFVNPCEQAKKCVREKSRELGRLHAQLSASVQEKIGIVQQELDICMDDTSYFCVHNGRASR